MYTLCLNVNIKSLTCPGVWLCPKGEVVLKISTLGVSKKTAKIYPKFPLRFNETLSFERLIIGGIGSTARTLETEEIHIELIQWTSERSKIGIVLAKVSQRVIAFFEPFVLDPVAVCMSNVEILVDRTDYFPGIISPKLCAVIHLAIKDGKYYDRFNSWNKQPVCENYLSRQRPVCHSNFSRPGKSVYDYFHSKCSFCSSWQTANDRFEESRNYDSSIKAKTRNHYCWCKLYAYNIAEDGVIVETCFADAAAAGSIT